MRFHELIRYSLGGTPLGDPGGQGAVGFCPGVVEGGFVQDVLPGVVGVEPGAVEFGEGVEPGGVELGGGVEPDGVPGVVPVPALGAVPLGCQVVGTHGPLFGTGVCGFPGCVLPGIPGVVWGEPGGVCVWGVVVWGAAVVFWPAALVVIGVGGPIGLVGTVVVLDG